MIHRFQPPVGTAINQPELPRRPDLARPEIHRPPRTRPRVFQKKLAPHLRHTAPAYATGAPAAPPAVAPQRASAIFASPAFSTSPSLSPGADPRLDGAAAFFAISPRTGWGPTDRPVPRLPGVPAPSRLKVSLYDTHFSGKTVLCQGLWGRGWACAGGRGPLTPCGNGVWERACGFLLFYFSVASSGQA